MNKFDENLVKETIGENLRKLQKASGLTQQEFANKTDVAIGTVSNYMKGLASPPVTYLARICSMEDFKQFELSLDTLAFEKDFDPENVTTQRPAGVFRNEDEIQHRDYTGTYITYIFDQTKMITEGSINETRELRYGVVNVYEKRNPIGDNTFHAIARFFKAEEKKIALELKHKIDEIFTSNSSQNEKQKEAHKLIQEKNEFYRGDLTFSENHMFILLESNEYSDNALIILYAPPKKKSGRPYIGGIGSICSVSRSRSHMPTAQKIILSRYEIQKSKEEIGSYLFLYPSNLSTTDEVSELIQLYKRLYSTSTEHDVASAYLSEKDKSAIFENRLSQIIRNYIEKTACCVAAISIEEDSRVYSLIKGFMKDALDSE